MFENKEINIFKKLWIQMSQEVYDDVIFIQRPRYSFLEPLNIC